MKLRTMLGKHSTTVPLFQPFFINFESLLIHSLGWP